MPVVTHLHGQVDVSDFSDGYPEAWYLPKARNLLGYKLVGAEGSHGRAWGGMMVLVAERRDGRPGDDDGGGCTGPMSDRGGRPVHAGSMETDHSATPPLTSSLQPLSAVIDPPHPAAPCSPYHRPPKPTPQTGSWHQTFKREYAAATGTRWNQGTLTSQYRNTQRPAALWYRDNA